ncbi:MAG: hypothetical protein R2748_25215 [Bryobacterales bacterium]
MARIRTKPREKHKATQAPLIGCALLIILAIAFLTWAMSGALSPN